MISKPHFLWTCSVVLLGALCGCATPGAPLPPSLRLPRQPEDLSAVRKGQRVILSWSTPAETTDKQRIQRLGDTWVCRTIGEYPAASCTVVKRIAASELESGGSERAVWEDVLPSDMISASGFASYAVEIFNDRGRTAGMSNQVRVSLAPTLPGVSDLRAELTPASIVLDWTSSAANGAQGLSFGYRVYRRAKGQKDFAIISEETATRTMQYRDVSFDWEHEYEYKVAPVTVLSRGIVARSEVEGENSNVVVVNAHDTFVPSQPTGVQAVFSGAGQQPFIDLTWAPNTDSDLAGYNVWRHTEGTAPVKINTEVVRAPSFRDAAVQTGTKYFYSVSASDLRGNESQRSEETSETVPQ